METLTKAEPGTNGAEPPPQIQEVALGEILRSPFNRNVDTKTPEFAELVESIRIHGVIQPGLARPLPTALDPTRKPGTPRLELVIGEHRWLGSQAAKRATMPLMVRQLTDIEVVELQTIENDKRKDLSPIEKAEKYQQLIDQYVKAGVPKEGAIATLCAKLSLGKSTVYEALRLLKLPAEAKAAVKAGKLPPSHAGLIGKLDDAPGLQARLVKSVLEPAQYSDTEGGIDGARLAYRALKEMVDTEVKLAPARQKWQAAAEAHRGKGFPVMDEETIAKVVSEYGGSATGGWVIGSTKTTDYVGCGQYPGKSYKDLMGKYAPPATLAHDREYKVLELFQEKLARKAIEAAGHKKKPRQTYSSYSPAPDKNAEEKRKARAERATRMRIVGKKIHELILKAAAKPKPKFPWRQFLGWLNDQIYTGISPKEIEKADSRPAQENFATLVRIMISDGESNGWEEYSDKWEQDTALAAKHYGIDLAKLTKELAPEPEPEPEKKAHAKGAKGAKGKVQTSGKTAKAKTGKTKRTGLTAATRKKLGGAMKARWAARLFSRRSRDQRRNEPAIN